MKGKTAILFLAAGLAWSSLAAEAVFEKIALPAKPSPMEGVNFVNRNADGGETIWTIRDIMSSCYVVSIDPATGKTTSVPLTSYGRCRMMRSSLGGLYIHAVGPKGGTFLKLDTQTNTWKPLGTSSCWAQYQLCTMTGKDGMLYAVTYPKTEVIPLDTRTDSIGKPVVIAEDDRQHYITQGIVTDEGIMYLTLGLHHMELWSYRPATGEKHQLLPESVTKAAKRPEVQLYTGKDGNVYTVFGGKTYRCFPDHLEAVSRKVGGAPAVCEKLKDGRRPVRVNRDAELILMDPATGKTSSVKTDLAPVRNRIYTLGKGNDGKIYGGTLSPAYFFSYDPATGKTADYGVVSAGKIQVYDILPVKDGLMTATYMGGNLDIFDPSSGRTRHVANLTKMADQERIYRLIYGEDGLIYGCTAPIKGHLGGSLFVCDPATLKGTVWKDPLPNLSCHTVAPAGKGMIFAGTSISGGTSAVPAAKEAEIMLLDVHSGKVLWHAPVFPGESHYDCAVALKNGLVCFTGRQTRKYGIFDVKTRKVLFSGELPEDGTPHFPRDCAADGSAVGIVGSTLFRIHPEDGKLTVCGQHPSLTRIIFHPAFGADGMLYYGSNEELWRVRLP